MIDVKIVKGTMWSFLSLILGVVSIIIFLDINMHVGIEVELYEYYANSASIFSIFTCFLNIVIFSIVYGLDQLSDTFRHELIAKELNIYRYIFKSTTAFQIFCTVILLLTVLHIL